MCAELTCTPYGVPAGVRAEGQTEITGDIYLNCAATAGERFSGSLMLFYSVNVTNRIAGDELEGVQVSVDGAPAAGAAVRPGGANAAAIENLTFDIPASGSVQLRISGVRVDAASLGLSGNTPVTASIAVTNGIRLTQWKVTVGVPWRGLMWGENGTAVNCNGSPVPATVDFPHLIAAGTTVFSTRVTEGFAASFIPAQAGGAGIRVMVRYTGLPSQMRLFVPDLIAGSTSVEPTSGGDLGGPAAGGRYTPGALLLALVPDAGPDGAGGTPAAVPAVGSTLTGASEIAVSNGSAYAVYEVMDANDAVTESAYIPTFVGSGPTGWGLPANVGRHTVMLAPLASGEAGSKAVPRFVEATPEPDCTALGDCSAFPQLSIEASEPFTFTAPAGGPAQTKFGSVVNTGGGYLAWSAKLVYDSGSGWASFYSEPGTSYQNGWFRVDVDPRYTPPGTYEARLIIDGGPTAGAYTVPVRLVVEPSNIPTAMALVNAATFARGPVAPGSLASLFGVQLAGKDVSVTFDGLPAQLLYADDRQINLTVPQELRPRTSTRMVVVVDGIKSASMVVPLTPMSPGIFGNGVLNQDYSLNSGRQPEARGRVLQVFATGLPAPEDGSVAAALNGVEIVPEYAGRAPGFVGLWQVNVRVPENAPTGMLDLSVCGVAASDSTKVCSPAMKVAIQ